MNFELETLAPVLQEVFHPVLMEQNITLKVLRLDLIDPITGGNKWFKLKYNLLEAEKLNCKTIISFGGPYSNHIAALASAGAKFSFKTIGIIRGELHDNPTLNRAKVNGMKLLSCGYDEYRAYRNLENWKKLYEEFPDAYIIPEGGSNHQGVQGCKLIAKFIPAETTKVYLPVGTGATLVGLVVGSEGKFKIEGVAVVKASTYLNNEVERMIKEVYADKNVVVPNNYLIHHDFTFGGYAKMDMNLIAFVDEFQKQSDIPIEPIYTGRMFYAILDQVKNGYFSNEDSIVAIHTGGNQYLLS